MKSVTYCGWFTLLFTILSLECSTINRRKMTSVLTSSLDHLWSSAPDRVRTCLDKISERAMKNAPVKSLIYQTLAQTNLFQFLRTGDSKCEEFITNLIKECETQHASDALGKQLHNCRAWGWLTADKDADAFRTRTWSFFSRLLTATQGRLQQLQEHWRQLKTHSQQQTEALKAVEEDIQRVTGLVHDVASQLYFASGAFKDPRDKDNERLTPVQLRRFWNESAPLFALLCILRVIFRPGKSLVFHRRRGCECGSYRRIESLGHWL